MTASRHRAAFALVLALHACSSSGASPDAGAHEAAGDGTPTSDGAAQEDGPRAPDDDGGGDDRYTLDGGADVLPLPEDGPRSDVPASEDSGPLPGPFGLEISNVQIVSAAGSPARRLYVDPYHPRRLIIETAKLSTNLWLLPWEDGTFGLGADDVDGAEVRDADFSPTGVFHALIGPAGASQASLHWPAPAPTAGRWVVRSLDLPPYYGVPWPPRGLAATGEEPASLAYHVPGRIFARDPFDYGPTWLEWDAVVEATWSKIRYLPGLPKTLLAATIQTLSTCAPDRPGSAWLACAPAGSFEGVIVDFALARASADAVLVSTYNGATYEHQLWRSTDRGQSYGLVTVPSPAASSQSVVVSPADPALFVVGRDRELYVTRDGGATFTPLSLPPAAVDTLVLGGFDSESRLHLVRGGDVYSWDA